MEQGIKWNFPAFPCPYEKKGLNDSGIETFNDNVLRSLAREICQNSLDARAGNNSTLPVTVEFSRFTCAASSFPGIDDFRGMFKSARSFWANDEKTREFCDVALATLDADTITWLRVSDFRTSGLRGVNQDCSSSETTPWSSLVMSSGVSDKQGSSGGSFGIGKFATFSCSSLRTSFYSTLTNDNQKGAQGVCRFVTFKNKENHNTTGLGYYMCNNQPLPELLNLDSKFIREEPGTDIYIPAFLASNEWFSDVKSSVLDGFLYAILHKKLVVVLRDENKEPLTLDDAWLREQYCNGQFESDTLRQNYEALTSNDVDISRKDFGEDGFVELRLLLAPNLDRRIAMIRETGMKIFPKGHFSSSISFSGVLVVLGEKLNARIKKFENPQHTKWEANRNPNDRYLLDKIYEFCREKLSEFVKSREAVELDAGLGNILPADAGAGRQDEAEALTIRIEKVSQQPKKRRRLVKREGEEFDDAELGQTSLEEEEQGGGHGDGRDSVSDSNSPSPGIDTGEGSGSSDADKAKRLKEVPTNVRKLRFICLDRQEGDYLLLITPAKSMEHGIVDVFAIAELSIYPASIISAETESGKALAVSGNRLSGLVFEKDVELRIRLKMDYFEYVSLEADCYGVV